ncbi:hypothetical protein M885DRAFT_621815 [Pelagophyceae sp. CCMP2097]|nr:hypothetical protein M885DRAFT_621815 [Pelagophyceae sp. CCMP2097]
MPLATPIVSVNASTQKLGVLPMLAAGLEHARLMGPVKLAAIWATTGMIGAWRPDVQSKAMRMHALGELFDGPRMEDAPYGQEAEPADLECDTFALPEGAPPRPERSTAAPRELFVKASRGAAKARLQLKTLGAAEAVLRED